MASESVTVKFVVADQAGHKVAYTDTGKLNSTHPVIILIPGIGDLRSQYRFLSPRFEKHHRVLTIDLRGLGDSDVGFDGYAPHQVGADIVQLIAKEKITASQGVILVGNSMGAAASEWVAAEYSSSSTSTSTMVRGIIMLGPFTRDPDASGAAMLFLRVLLGGFWGVSVWRYYYKSLHVTKKPQDLDEHVRELAANLKQKGRHDVLLKLLFASKAECARRIPEVKAPVLVIMGDKDPDFSKPEEEVKWIENAFTSTSVTSLLVEGAGHYPHVEFPSQVYASSKAFIKSLSRSH